MQSVEAMTERILYWLSLDTQVRALAERLLERFAVTVGDLPASAKHHHSEPGGLYRHSLEVALKALEEFEGNMIMERRPDGSVDGFRSSRNRPRWQYASFIAALCHDLGKLFELEVRGRGETWCPLDEPYAEFGRRTMMPVANWRPDREHGAHAKLSSFAMHHVLSRADIAYLGLPRFVHMASCLSDEHSSGSTSPMSQVVSRSDQASVEQAQPSIATRPGSKVGLLLQALEELITNGALGVNVPGAQVYVEGDRAAVVVPVAVSMARDHLSTKRIVLPPNSNLYNLLRSARLVDADQAGRSVRRIKLQGRQGPISLSALIFPTDKVVPKYILPTLPPTHFEIETEPAPEATAVVEE
jgi:Putative helicase